MASLYTHQDANNRKTWLLMGIFLILIIFIGWFVSLYFNSPIILYIAVAFSIFMNFFSYWYSDKIVIKMSGAKPVRREDYWDLWNSVENLSITAGLPMPKLYIIEDHVPNAFATGRDKEHAAVAVTTGLLSILNRNELDGVMAHELSHIGNKDILIGTIVVVLVGFITILADVLIRSALWGGRGGNNKHGGALMMVGFVLAILSPLFATLIQLAVSRKREFLADASGALLTRYPEGLASALEKINSHSGKMKKASKATAHLYISNPFGSRKKVAKLFMTHPPTKDRVDALRNLREV